MGKWFKWIFAAIGIALLLVILVWGVSKLVGPSRAERAALAVMSEPLQFSGRNAYPAIWLLDYPVPQDQMEAVMAEDVRRFVQSPLPDENTAPMDFTTSAAQRYRSDRPAYEVRQRLCSAREDCLAKVRADLPGYEKLLEDHGAWIARTEQATHADHLRNPFPARFDMPLPTFVSTYAPATLFAVRFAQGQREAAIASTCRAITDWRKLGAHDDMLISWAVARSFSTEGYGGLLAQMLAEVPNGQPLPSACTEAMTVPVAAEISMCTTMRGEFGFMSQSMASIIDAESHKRGLQQKIFSDGDMTKAMMAVPMAKYCAPATDAAFAADKATPMTPSPGLYRLQCVANAVGCILSDVAAPGYQGFDLGHRDGLAMKRTLAGLAWWRAQPDAAKDPKAMLARLPAEFRSAAHPLKLNPEKTALVMPTLNGNKEDIVLPLPGSRAQPAPAK